MTDDLDYNPCCQNTSKACSVNGPCHIWLKRFVDEAKADPGPAKAVVAEVHSDLPMDPDAALITLAPELAKMILALDPDPDTPFPLWQRVLEMQDRLRAMGGKA